MPDPKVDYESWSARKVAAHKVSVTLAADLTAVVICKGRVLEVYGNNQVADHIRGMENYMPLGGEKFYGPFATVIVRKWESLNKQEVIQKNGKRLKGKSFGVKGAIAAFGLPD